MGNCIGVERAIISLDPRDFVVLACRLIQDEATYREWSAHALKRFEMLGPEFYVQGFELIPEERLRGGASS